MNRTTLLEQKAEEVRAQLELWAKSSLQLTDREQLHCEIRFSITSVPICTVITQTPGKRRREPVRCTRIGNDLSAQDWECILAVAWTNKPRQIVEALHENNNRLRPKFDHSRLGPINIIFRDRGLNYRIYEVGKRKYWGDVDVSIYKVEIMGQTGEPVTPDSESDTET